eukprot:scpid18796/ scgid0488/ Probable serine/threonine-protein kinase pats1; Protein associated with the transduction of signal 1
MSKKGGKKAGANARAVPYQLPSKHAAPPVEFEDMETEEIESLPTYSKKTAAYHYPAPSKSKLAHPSSPAQVRQSSKVRSGHDGSASVRTGASTALTSPEDPWHHPEFPRDGILSISPVQLRNQCAVAGLITTEELLTLERRQASLGPLAHNEHLLSFLQHGGGAAYAKFLPVLGNLGYMHLRRKLEKLLPARHQAHSSSASASTSEVMSTAEFAKRRTEVDELFPLPSKDNVEELELEVTEASDKPPRTIRGRKRDETAETELARQFGLVKKEPLAGTGTSQTAAPKPAPESATPVRSEHTTVTRQPLQEPLGQHGIEWLSKELGQLRNEKVEKWWTVMLPKWKLSKPDQESIARLLIDPATSNKKRVARALRILVDAHGDQITNQHMLDSLWEGELHNTRLRFRGFVGGTHTTSKPKERTAGSGLRGPIMPVQRSELPSEICGLRRRQIHQLSELLNAETNPRTRYNWKELARRLHYDYKPAPNSFRDASDPTLELLLHWHTHHRGDLETLRKTLASIERPDCVKILPIPLHSYSGKVATQESDLRIGDMRADVIDSLCQVLYRKSHFQNWYALGLCLKVPEETLKLLEKEGSRAPQLLFARLGSRSSDGAAGSGKQKHLSCTVFELYRALLAINRQDVAEMLDDLVPEKSFKDLKVDPSPPEIHLQPTACDIPPGSAARLVCFGSGYPVIRYQWLCNGEPRPGATQHRFVTHRPGKYSCRISNDLTSVMSLTVTVSQAAPDEIVSQGTNAVQTYTIALSEGSICTNRVRVMVIGQDRTGKSSLIRSLLKKAFEQSDSTVGIDIATATFSLTSGALEYKFSADDACMFVEDVHGGENFTRGEVARAVASHLHSRQQQEQLKATESEDMPSAQEVMEKVRTESVASQLDVHAEETDGSSEEPASATDGGSGVDVFAGPDEPEEHELTRQEAVEEFSVRTDEPMLLAEPDGIPLAKPASLEAGESPESQTGGAGKLAHSESIEMTPELQKMVSKLLEEVQVDCASEQVLVRIYDFAGQPVYYNTHSVFMSESGVYLLVHNMAKSLQGEAQVRFSEDGHERVIDKDEFLSTNLDYLYSWMSAVYTATGSALSGRSPLNNADAVVDDGEETDDNSSLSDPGAGSNTYVDPPVLVVGTHRDDVAKRGHHMLAKAIIEKSEELDKHLGSKAYGLHLSRPFFFVDNSVSGSGVEDPEVALLRQSIRSHAMRQPGTRQRVPIKWLKCELLIEKLVHQEHVTHMSFKDFQALAAKVEIRDPETLRTMLEFYNRLGVLVYFGNSPQLHNLVVLDPQWLANVFKQLITVPPMDELNPQQAAWWKCVTETGLLHANLVKDIWSDEKLRPQRSKLLAIMAKFDLVCPFHTSYRVDANLAIDGKQSVSDEERAAAIARYAHLEYDDLGDAEKAQLTPFAPAGTAAAADATAAAAA